MLAAMCLKKANYVNLDNAKDEEKLLVCSGLQSSRRSLHPDSRTGPPKIATLFQLHCGQKWTYLNYELYDEEKEQKKTCSHILCHPFPWHK